MDSSQHRIKHGTGGCLISGQLSTQNQSCNKSMFISRQSANMEQKDIYFQDIYEHGQTCNKRMFIVRNRRMFHFRQSVNIVKHVTGAGLFYGQLSTQNQTWNRSMFILWIAVNMGKHVTRECLLSGQLSLQNQTWKRRMFIFWKAVNIE